MLIEKEYFKIFETGYQYERTRAFDILETVILIIEPDE